LKRYLENFKGGNLKARLLQGLAGTAFLKVINIFLALVSSILLARVLGPENYGIYSFAISIITLLSLPTNAGLPTLIVRETTKYQLQGNWGLFRGLLALANVFVISFSIFIAIVSAIIAWWVWGDEQSLKYITFLWALLLLPFIAFAKLRSSTLLGLRKVIRAQLPEELVQPMVMIVLLLLCIFLGSELTPFKVVQYNVFAAFIAFFVGALLLKWTIPKQVKVANKEYRVKAWVSSLIPLSLIVGVQAINKQVGIVTLGMFGSATDVALYKIASTAVGLSTIGLMITNPVLGPYITRLAKQNKREQLQKIFIVSARVSFLITVLILSVFVFFGERILSLLFGDEYIGANPALLILCIGQLGNVLVGSVGLILKQLSFEKLVLRSVTFSMIVNVMLCYLLVPTYGANGAAVAMTASFLLWNAANWWQLFNVTGYDSSIFGFKK